MIDYIIEESYQKKDKKKVEAIQEEIDKSEVFHHIENDIKFKSSLLVNKKVKNADMTINSNIDTLLSFSINNRKNKFIKESISKIKKQIFVSEPLNKLKKNLNRHSSKDSISLSEKMIKTKMPELSVIKKTRKINSSLGQLSRMYQIKKKNIKNIKNIKKDKFSKNNSMINFNQTGNSNTELTRKKQNISANNSDSFFITKVSQNNFYPTNTSYIFLNRNIKNMSKEKKLRKMRKLIKESNSQMLDIYTGLINIKNNQFTTTFNDIMNLEPNSKRTENENHKMDRNLRNIEKFINSRIENRNSVANINRKFRLLFQKIFKNKKYSNDKLDARTIMDPLDKIIKGGYKEVRLDNNFNQTLGQRIWIKKSTSNVLSFGKSCQKMSDDVFYNERKRLLAIYPKIQDKAKLLVQRKIIERRNPLLKRLVNNINKINDIFLEEYDLIKRVKRKMEKAKEIK